jgi:AraC-like DNA-binding protein
MSRWLVWILIGVASCCSLLAVNGWAQNASPVAAAEYTAADGAIATPTEAVRWSGRVQIGDQPQQALTPDPRQPVVLQLESSERQLSFYLQIPEPAGTQTGYRYQLSGWDTQWQPLHAGANFIRYAALPVGHYRFLVQSGSADAAAPPVLCEIWVAAGNWRSSWWLPPLVLLCVLLLWAGYHGRKVFSRPSHQNLLPLADLHEQNQQLQQQLARQQASHGRLANELRGSLMLLTPQLATLQAASDPSLWQGANQVARGVCRLQGLLNQLIQITQSAQTAWSERQSLILLAWLTPRLEQYRLEADARQISWHIAMVPDIAVTLDSQLLDNLVRILFNQTLHCTPSGSALHLAFCLDEQRNQLVFRVRGTPLAPDVTLAGGDDADTLEIRLLQQQVRQQGGELSLPGEAAGDQGWLVRLPCLWTRLNWLTTHQEPLALPLPPADAPLLLLVEDDPDLQQLLLGWLSSEYRILISSSIRGGLISARDALPDLILCDQQLPDGECYPLLDELKSTAETSHIPIIICSVFSDEASRRRAWHQKADDYIQKPFEPALLRLRLQALLQNRQRLQQWLHASLSLSQHVLAIQDVPVAAPLTADLPPAELLFSEQLRTISCQLLREDQMSVERLAEHFNMSIRSLQRKLHSLFGLSYSDYARELQLQLVVEQLQQGASVKEAAAAAGFRDQSYLTRVFKQQFGVTPSQYKKQQRVTTSAQ